ncbi:MAG TPA: hypothetical protein VE242_14290 [Chthoniobacterales bacterium]|nr:hypothetical protein [Chthoniobacterales bacterium]
MRSVLVYEQLAAMDAVGTGSATAGALYDLLKQCRIARDQDIKVCRECVELLLQKIEFPVQVISKSTDIVVVRHNENSPTTPGIGNDLVTNNETSMQELCQEFVELLKRFSVIHDQRYILRSVEPD